MRDSKRARDLMIPMSMYPRLRHSATLLDAVKELKRGRTVVKDRMSHPRYILIFDELEVLVGVVRRRDIMRGLEPEFLVHHSIEHRKGLFDVKADPNLTEMIWDRMLDGIRAQLGKRVSDVMQPLIGWVNAEDHLLKVVYELVDNNTALLPVLENGRVAGVIRSVDVFQELAELLGPTKT